MPLVIFQLKTKMEKKTNINIPNRMAMEHTIPVAETGTGSPNTIVKSSQGNGNPTVTSKMLDPTEEDTAMSPNPLRATITLVIRSGIEVPAAKNVRPMTGGGILKTSPAYVAHQTIKYEKMAIHRMLPINVMGKNFRAEALRVSGKVSQRGIIMGRMSR